MAQESMSRVGFDAPAPLCRVPCGPRRSSPHLATTGGERVETASMFWMDPRYQELGRLKHQQPAARELMHLGTRCPRHGDIQTDATRQDEPLAIPRGY